MSKSAFTEALAWELRLRGVSHVRPDLEAFVRDVWPLAEEDPDVNRWAKEYAEYHQPATADQSEDGQLSGTHQS
jgi:hypothetical protein